MNLSEVLIGDPPGPDEILAPGAAPAGRDVSGYELLRRGMVRRSSGAEGRPAPMRPGAEAALALPSRMANRLHYRDGRVTGLDGQAARA